MWESSEELAEVAGGDDSSDDQPSTSDHKSVERKDLMWEEHHRSPIRYLKRLTNWVRQLGLYRILITHPCVCVPFRSG